MLGLTVTQIMPLDRRRCSSSCPRQWLTTRTLSFVLLLCIWLDLPRSVYSWQISGRANSHLDAKASLLEIQRFGGNESAPDYFKILLTEGDHMLVGARNYVYNISLSTLRENKKITWFASEEDITMCKMKQKSPDQCQNYIRVLVKLSDSDLLVCGTNAFKPWCRTYRNQMGSMYVHLTGDTGIAKCPYDPIHNNTAVYVDERLFTATVSDMNGRDPLLYSQPMRTEQHDSQWLNEPNFVSSFDYGDKVYFFFRETAVEYINCGKNIYSRVARVCKNDQGGERALRNTWTSYFKARLNCSIPGEFPFYFDEIQSTSELGQGNYMPALVWENRTDMVYAVFNTPGNSITGSAICAYRFSDIIKSFEGPFKEQKEAHFNWLPVKSKDTPSPHPAQQCANDSSAISDQTLNFIKSHPLMDTAVPAFGGHPLFIQTSFQFRLTQIAVDWQVLAADNRYYDVLFIGTDDGRVMKAINKGHTANVETVIIEDIQVFDNKAPITNLRVYRNPMIPMQEKLIVVSRDEIRSIPLHRCHLRSSCGKCVGLQDPYCSWSNGRCENSNDGIQSIDRGEHPSCPSDGSTGGLHAPSTTEAPTSQQQPCVCPSQQGSADPILVTTTERSRQTQAVVIDSEEASHMDNSIPNFLPDNHNPNHVDLEQDPAMGSQLGGKGHLYTAQEMAIATVVCIVVALFLGFLIGYRVSLCRNSHRSPHDPFLENKSDILHKAHMEPHHYNHEPYLNSSLDKQKQLNVVFNPVRASKMPNGSVETTIQPHKVKKVYL